MKTRPDRASPQSHGERGALSESGDQRRRDPELEGTGIVER